MLVTALGGPIDWSNASMSIDGPPSFGIRHVVRGCYLAAGLVLMALGVIGALLPVMPTTVFVLGAVWCFSRSSPSLEAWLIHRSPFRGVIFNWQQFHVIPLSAKYLAGLSLTICLPVLFFASDGFTVWFVGSAAGLLVLYAYMWSFPHNSPHANTVCFRLGGEKETERAGHA